MLEQLGIKKVTIPLPFRLNHVHCFLAEGENGYTVIDTGLHDDQTSAIWKKELDGLTVQKIVLTHLHPDHCGYAGTLQQELQTEVWMTQKDAEDLQTIWVPEALPILRKSYEQAAVPTKIADGIIQITKNFFPYVTPLPQINHYLKDGDTIQLGKEQFEVIATPGHSAGLVCFFQKEKGILLSTDHILPKITPNIAYWFYGEENPLQSFEESLNKIKKFEAEYVIPSHGEPFQNANKRVDEIWHHHELRLEQVLQTAKSGITIFDMCEILFPKQLSTYDYQFAIGETMAHLIYVYEKDLLVKEFVDGKWMYFRR